MKQAMRAKDKPRVAVLKSVITEVTYAEKNATNDETATAALSDTGVIITLQRSIKKRQESIDAYKSANRDDLALKEQEEITMLVGYLPAQLTPQEIETEVKRAVDEVDATTVKDMGRVMRAIRIEPGRASKQAIADTIKSVFSNKKSA
ncbi:Yqey-like protein-domain-containing protein [Syncephalis fuscata]|nr:Yqey-like protein-domain-containing protein [Syncephalis fuscata]